MKKIKEVLYAAAAVLIFAAVISAVVYYQNSAAPGGGTETFLGKIEMSFSSWSPSFDECIMPAPLLRTDNNTFYLKNICNYINPSGSEIGLYGKNVEIKGKLIKEELDVPLRKEQNSPTEKRLFDVIMISDLKILDV
jgi:hypothetical protein